MDGRVSGSESWIGDIGKRVDGGSGVEMNSRMMDGGG